MRTRDFSACEPPQAQVGSMFLGQNEYRSPQAMAGQLLRWPPLARRLKASPGYLWHRSYFRFPRGIGLIVCFDSRESLMEFAKTPEHHAIMHWLVGTDEDSESHSADPSRAPAKAGFIRILQAESVGYANGAWRADRPDLQMVRRWEDQRPQDLPPGTLPAALRRTVTGAGALRRTLRSLLPGSAER